MTIEESLNTIISFCESIPECGQCPYYRGCRSAFPDKVLAVVLSDIIRS